MTATMSWATLMRSAANAIRRRFLSPVPKGLESRKTPKRWRSEVLSRRTVPPANPG